jgi:hypothetical protein
LAACCLVLALWGWPGHAASPAPASPAGKSTSLTTTTSVLRDPHYLAWHQALEDEAALARQLRQAATSPEICGSYPALRATTLRKHELRMQLLQSLAERGVAPTPPAPGVTAWPWGPGADRPAAAAGFDSLNTAVVVDDGRIVSLNLRGALEVDPLLAARAFYAAHDDEYDFLLMFTNFPSDLFEGRFLAYQLAVSNDIDGLGFIYAYGADFFDTGPEFTGNPGPTRLQSFVHLNNLYIFPPNPNATFYRSYTTPAFIGHEFAHRWGAHIRLCPDSGPPTVLLGQGLAHWSFFLNTGASVLEGNLWDGDGVTWSTQGATTGYNPLDLYLMGMVPLEEVPTAGLWYIDGAHDCVEQPPVDEYPALDLRHEPFNVNSPPQTGVRCLGTRIDFTPECVTVANGPRIPGYPNAPREFRVATLLMTTPETPAQPAELEALDRLRTQLGDFFATQTLGRGRLDFTLRSVPARVVFVHHPQGDVEDPTQPIRIGTQIALQQRSLPTLPGDVDVKLLYSVNGGGWTETPMQHDSPDMRTAAIPPQPLGSQISYWMESSTHLSEHRYVWPEGAPGTTFAFRVRADTEPPTLAHVPVRRYSRNAEPLLLRAVVLDAHGVEDVHVEYRLGNGPLQTRALARVGTTDVFETRLVPPGAVDDTVEYRIVARDVAQATHTASAPASGFFPLRITLVQYEDAEAVDPLWTHQSLTAGGPDQWHRERQNHTPPGTWCWKVGPENVSTNPRIGQIALEQNSVLVTPAVRLREGWQLRFWHRYYFRTAPPDADESGVDGAILQWQDVEDPAMVAQDIWYLIDPVDGYNNQLGPYAYFSPIQWFPAWSGNQDFWKLEVVDQTGTPRNRNFDGKLIRFRFRVSTSISIGRTTPGAGWYIDDIEIDPAIPVAIAIADLQAARFETGVRLTWRAQGVEPGDLFRIYRADVGSDGRPQEFGRIGVVTGEPGTENYAYVDATADAGRAFAYRLGLVTGGRETPTREVIVTAPALRFALHANRPNPFNPRTEIAFDLPARGRAQLVIYAVNGTRIRGLLDAVLDPGPHRSSWDGTDDAGRAVSSGLYLYRLQGAGQAATRRMMLLR